MSQQNPETKEEGHSSSLQLASSSEYDSSSNQPDFSSEAEEIVPPPEHKVLPLRSTRGKRLREMVDSEEELDKTFWGHETWEEEDGDGEWSTEDEGRYKDKFDSDFLEASSPEGESEEERVEGAAKDKQLKKEERSAARKKFNYEIVAKRRQDRKQKSTRVWSVLDPNFKLSATPKRGGKKQAPTPTSIQAQLMVEARRTEAINLKIQTALDEAAAEGVSPYTPAQRVSNLSGDVVTFVSWASDRKIEAEEARKSAEQKLRESSEPVHERQMLFFVNTSDPKLSRIPQDLYEQSKPRAETPPKCAVTGKPGRYIDPLSGKWYADAEAFRKLRCV